MENGRRREKDGKLAGADLGVEEKVRNSRRGEFTEVRPIPSVMTEEYPTVPLMTWLAEKRKRKGKARGQRATKTGGENEKSNEPRTAVATVALSSPRAGRAAVKAESWGAKLEENGTERR